MRFKDRIQNIKYLIIPMIGIFFLLFYIRAAGADIVYSDYIRIINEYLPDVNNASKMFVPDILTRIPATFLARLVNVRTFSYSVTFDRILSLIGIAIMAWCLGYYFYRHEISFKWQIMIYIVLFSLNKWEILLNGTAWAHVVSFGLFFINYLLIDQVWNGEATTRQELVIVIMPVIMLLFAGEYIVSYACTLILASLLGILTGGANGNAGQRERALFRSMLVSATLALILYVTSRHFAVWEHSGATDAGIIEVILQEPLYLPKFFIKTFAGAVVGQETINNFLPGGMPLPNRIVLIIGAAVLAGYILAFITYFTADMLEHTIFPLILLISGFGNHMLVTIGRWIFMNESYALSSRYSGQFMVGLIGMLLIFSMCDKYRRHYRRKDESKRTAVKAGVIFITVLIILGNCYTSYQEINKAKYREANYERMMDAVLNYETYPEEELMSMLEWHKSPDDLYNALNILKDNKLNVFSRPHF
ncbi:MAG: hypothetical protein Q4E57_02795 [Eubacteriales bacterium]|nr:hypothetical protein [Eubacteriales bacterium]